MKPFLFFIGLFCGSLVFSQEKLEYKTNLEFGLGGNQKLFFRPEVVFNRFQSSGASNEGLQFKNNTFGLNLGIEYGLHKLTPSNFNGRADSEVFLNAHFGLLHSNPFTVIEGEKVFLAPLQLQDATYGKLVPVIGAGINFNFKLNKTNRIGLRFDVNYTLSDYADNVSNGEGVSFQNNLGNTNPQDAVTSKIVYREEDFNLDSRSDLFFRILLIYEFQWKTRFVDDVHF